MNEGSFETKPVELEPDIEAFSEQEVRDSLDRFLQTHRPIDNAGKNAVILKLLENELSPRIQEAMAGVENEDNPEGSISVKALKIYNPGDAEREYKALKEARAIVRKSESADALARVPRAYGHYEIEIGDDLKKFLNDGGASIAGDKAGMIVMDYIEGEDLAAVLHREFLKRYTSDEDPYPYPTEDIANPSFDKLFQMLEKSDFVLPKEIVAQIRRTVDLLHANGLYHNDIHARNIVLHKADLKNPQAFLIDFATATKGQPAPKDEKNPPLDDGNIINRLTPLTKTTEDKLSEERERHEDEWKRRLSIIEDHPKAQKRYAEVKALAEAGDDRRLASSFISSTTIESDFKTFLGILLKLYREEPAQRERITELVNREASNEANRPFVLKKMREWKEVVGI